MRLSIIQVGLAGLLTGVPDIINGLPVPDKMIALNTSAGLEILARTGTRRGAYDAAFIHFEMQQDESSCSRASAVTVLNAMATHGIQAPVSDTYSPYAYWTQESFINDACVASNCTAPCTLNEAANALACQEGVASEALEAYQLGVQGLRNLVNQTSSTFFVIANFQRSAVGMVGGGHFSPVVAYNEDEDLALVLDVAKYKYPPTWMPVATLWSGIDTLDRTASDKRGIIRVSVI